MSLSRDNVVQVMGGIAPTMGAHARVRKMEVSVIIQWRTFK